MANITNNRISEVLTDLQVTTLKTTLNDVKDLMPFLIGLTVDERVRLPKIDVSNRHFVKDVLTALLNNPGFLPVYINAAEMEKDFKLYEQLDEILLIINGLAERVRDTQILAGSEAYTNALVVYKSFQLAAEAGIPGADAIYDSLKERFARTGSTDNNATPPQS